MLIVLIVLLTAALLWLAVSYYFTLQAIKPNCVSVERQIQRTLTDNGLDASIVDEPFEFWTLTSRRGTKLSARFYDYGGDTVLLLNHGYNSPWISMLKYLPLLKAQGCSVLIPDHQAEGDSEGKWITYGILESEDGLLWLEEISRRFPKKERAVMGESLGGATSLLIAEKCPDLSFCVADCPYHDCERELSFIGEKRYRLPMKLVMPGVRLWFRLLTGRSMREASPLNFIDKLSVPTLLIHGDADLVVPVDFSRELAPKNKNITYWECHGAAHVMTLVREPQRYAEAMSQVRREVRI